MLRFPNTPQQYPERLSPEERKHHFDEIYARFDPSNAATQASRCSQCGIPFCQVHCPLENNIPEWLKLTAEGRMKEAYDLSSATNSFPEICGRICPQDKLCEGNCVIEPGFGSVTIGSVETYITETAFANDWVKAIKPKLETGRSIGIIGAGPAGLAAADMLRRHGHMVHVYDRYDRVGGLLIYGIPNFKLDKQIVLRRHKLLEESNIHFHLNYDVSHNFAELREQHDALLVATGVYRPRDPAVPPYEFSNVLPALHYLTASNKQNLGDTLANADNLNMAGKHVVVLGGGDTTMDCVRTAIRQEAASVRCVYRRDRVNMPGSLREVSRAEEEGVLFDWLATPVEFYGEDATLKGVKIQRTRLVNKQGQTRQSVELVDNAFETIDADVIILALGFEAENMPEMFNEPGLNTRANGTLPVDMQLMTNLPGVFAAGDIARGASLVVWAIRDGRDAARSIHHYISNAAS